MAGKIIFTLIVHLFFTMVVLAQNNKKEDSAIHHIIIFKIINNGKEQHNFIKIDAKGNFEQKKEEQKNSGVIKNFAVFCKEIKRLIHNGQLQYVAPSDNPPRAASMPKLNEQSVYFTIVTNAEVNKSKGFNTASYYKWNKSNIEINRLDYDLLESINALTRKQLLHLLANPAKVNTH